MSTPDLKLVSKWTPARDGAPMAYTIELTNGRADPLRDFKLGVNGHVRFDARARLDGGTLVERLSNHTLIAPPAGFVLAPGATWSVTTHSLPWGPKHWSDGVTAAYVVLADSSTMRVSVTPTQLTGSNAPLLKGAMRFPVPKKVPAPISVIPWPRRVAVTGACAVPPGLDPQPADDASRSAAEAFAILTRDLFPAEALVRSAPEGGVPVRMVSRNELGREAYTLQFAEDSVTVSASAHSGYLYGLITLGQILRGAKQHPDLLSFPSGGEIADEPGLAWRGTHLDVSRQFYTTAEVERFMKIIAWNKMNRLHLHLSEDEAWRVEIDAYPELTAIGAWRGHGKALPPMLGSGPQPTGGYYTKAAIRGIVALGDRLGLTIVPEIDIPGHCYAALQALPWLRDPGEIGEYQSVQGFPNNCLNPALEQTYRFVETVIDEMLELFTGGIFHIGADEVPLAAWSGSPLALDMLEKLAGKAMADKHRQQLNTLGNHGGADEIEGSPTAILQAEFIKRIHRHIASKGAITGGWEEAAHGNVIDKTTSYLVGWRSVEVNAELAAAGYNIVVSPGQRYYLDMAHSTSWSEPGAHWAGWSGARETYEFEPRQGMSADAVKHLLGVQSCIWSESMTDRAIFDRLVFPRISAVAETGWTLPEHKSFDRFAAFAGLMPILYGHWAEPQG